MFSFVLSDFTRDKNLHNKVIWNTGNYKRKKIFEKNFITTFSLKSIILKEIKKVKTFHSFDFIQKYIFNFQIL